MLPKYPSQKKAGRTAKAILPTLADGQLRCIFIVPKRKGWLQPLAATIYSLAFKVHDVAVSVKKLFSEKYYLLVDVNVIMIVAYPVSVEVIVWKSA